MVGVVLEADVGTGTPVDAKPADLDVDREADEERARTAKDDPLLAPRVSLRRGRRRGEGHLSS